MKCPSCRYPLVPGADVCGNCGLKVMDSPTASPGTYRACVKCGLRVGEYDVTCSRCGSSLSEARRVPDPTNPPGAPARTGGVTGTSAAAMGWLALSGFALLGGWATLTQATLGVGAVCTACLFAIAARIAQASAHHQQTIAEIRLRRDRP